MSKLEIPKWVPPFRAWDGPLTQELVLQPGKFGLGKIPARLIPDDTTSMVCGFCSTGCSLNVHLKEGEAVNLTPDFNYPVNLGMACPKGWEALTPLAAPDRALTPMLRGRSGVLEPVDWERAMVLFSSRFKDIQARHGQSSVAYISTGQIVSEEMAFLGAVAKFGMGILHGDGNTRQCMATAVAAYKESFGFDSPPFTYGDFEESDVIVLIGSNLCIAHPILWQRVMRNKRNPEIVVIDPRKTETAMAATRHYAIRPKSDLSFLYGIANRLIAKGAVDRAFVDAHTTGFAEFQQFVSAFSTERLLRETGLTEAELAGFADLLSGGKRVSFWWTMGVNQGHEATRTAQAIINLALMTGNIGKPGTGANSITGQCNAMGSRLFSNTTNLLGGHDFRNPAHREKVAAKLGIEAAHIPDQNSWAYDQIIEGVQTGAIKGLWIIATNTAHSWIHQNGFREVRDKLEFLVVQDMYATTETAAMADLFLPAAGWGEKEGTFINSERRIGLVKKVSKAPGQALADFHIFQLVAHYWGCAHLFREWTSPEAVFQILKRVTASQPCDINGIEDYAMLDREGGVQWPLPAGEKLRSNQRRLFADGKFFHADGRARFIFEEPRPLPEAPCSEFPFLLLTGRGSSAQWHTQSRTSKSAVLRKLYPAKLHLEIHPEDARELGIETGDLVLVESRRGRVPAYAFISASVQRKQLFFPMHDARVNQLTYPAVDPYSRQPSYKACAVRVAREE